MSEPRAMGAQAAFCGECFSMLMLEPGEDIWPAHYTEGIVCHCSAAGCSMEGVRVRVWLPILRAELEPKAKELG